MTKDHKVYHIAPKGKLANLNFGYVGVSKDYTTRLASHKRQANVNAKETVHRKMATESYEASTISFKGIALFTKEEAYAIEYHHRKTQGIAWNDDAGGKQSGMPFSSLQNIIDSLINQGIL